MLILNLGADKLYHMFELYHDSYYIHIFHKNFKTEYPDMTKALRQVHNHTINVIMLIPNMCIDLYITKSYLYSNNNGQKKLKYAQSKKLIEII